MALLKKCPTTHSFQTLYSHSEEIGLDITRPGYLYFIDSQAICTTFMANFRDREGVYSSHRYL
jgi:hypothetical protein